MATRDGSPSLEEIATTEENPGAHQDGEKKPLSTVSTPVADPASAADRPHWLTSVKRRFGFGAGRPVSDSGLPRSPRTRSLWSKLWRLLQFLGPGSVVTVAYIDPDNWQTAITSGASFQYKLLFMILVSNLIAIYLQALSVKLGTVTGLDLAQMNHRCLPRWLDLAIYAVAEACIICTDIGQVIGTAIALNILIPPLPLPAACAISVVETLLILLFYTPTGKLRRVRLFEIFIALLVAAIFAIICVALTMVSAPAGEVFRGFLPSRDIFVSTGLYESCAILGGTLMPHALYVGSSLSRSRLYDFDEKHGLGPRPEESPAASTETLYKPSLRAIKACLSYSIAELCITLFSVAIFVNSALIIISGSAFFDPDDDDGISGDLYDLYGLFTDTIAPVAGTLFAVSLLFSGVSAGIVATMAGQLVMEGALNIRISPFLRRLVTRCVAIIPALIVAVSVGQDGLSRALVACNYVLAIGLIFITFPLVYYTSRDKYMRVATDDGTSTVSMRNSIPTAAVAWIVWLLVAVMDIATVVLIGLGLTSDDD